MIIVENGKQKMVSSEFHWNLMAIKMSRSLNFVECSRQCNFRVNEMEIIKSNDIREYKIESSYMTK